MQTIMIAVGNYFFKWRNKVFPLILLALYVLAVPAKESTQDSRDIIAVLVALSGLAVRGIVIGYAYIKRGGLNKKVYAETLVTEGMFTLCRNPLYFGNILIYCGVFLMHGNPVVAVPGMALFLFIYWCIVFAEESYLRAKFGEQYEAYCRTTPRFIPKVWRFRQATQGMHFNLRRVILKDYPTIATTIAMLSVTEIYEYLEIPGSAHYGYVAFQVALILAVGGMAAGVRTLKKRKLLVEG